MTTRPTYLAMFLALALGAAACTAASDALEGSSDGPDRADEPVTGPGTDMPVPDEFSWQRIEGRDDLVGPRLGWVEQLRVDPDDDRVLLVRFFGGVAECHGANATVISRTAGEIVVALEIGAVPAAGRDLACIDIAIAQEIAIELDAPVGAAQLRALEPDAGDGSADPGDVEPAAPDGYLGLTKEAAIDRAEAEGRVWRIAREDGEQYVLTMDYLPDRINFEVDGGVVTTVWMG